MKWLKTVDPSAVQGIPGVVSENSRPFFVVVEPLEATEGLLSPRQTEVLCFAAAGCTERETAMRLGIASATVRGYLARVSERLGARSTCPQATSSGLRTCQAVALSSGKRAGFSASARRGDERGVMRRLIAGHRLVGLGSRDPWQELAIAVLLRAVRDSLTDPEAATWLRTCGDELAHALGWPAGALREFDPERVDWRVLSPWGNGWKFPRRTTPWP